MRGGYHDLNRRLVNSCHDKQKSQIKNKFLLIMISRSVHGGTQGETKTRHLYEGFKSVRSDHGTDLARFFGS
jgi:hypothetical protein